MEKAVIYQQEHDKLTDIFKVVEPEKQKLCAGLIQHAAFLYAENTMLEESMKETGMIKINPKNPAMQKATEAGKQYLKSVQAEAVVIKALGSVLNKANTEDGDDLSDYE